MPLFLQQYQQLINDARNRSIEEGIYYELHHIVPRAHGGTNDKENLINLTAKEHFEAHRLLWLIYRDPPMTKAFKLMCEVTRGGEVFEINAEEYQILKEEFSKAQQEARLGKESPAKGRKWTDESKAKLSASLMGNSYSKGKPSNFKGKTHSDEAKAKVSAAQKGNTNRLGIPFSEETKATMSTNRKGKTKVPWTEERKAARRALLAEKKKS